MGKVLILLGIALLVVGVVVWSLERGAPGGGRLPGDVSFGGRGWRVHFPLAAGILISLALTAVLNLVLWLTRRR